MAPEDNEVDTRDRILSLALELMTTQGFEKTTIGQIADGMGFSKAAVYYHFNSKDEILSALVNPYLDRLEALIADVRGGANSPAGRKELVEAYMDLLLDQRALVVFLTRDVSALHHPVVEGRIDELTTRLLARLGGPRGGQAAKIRAASALGALLKPLIDFRDEDMDKYKDMLISCAIAVTKTRLPR